MEKITVSLANQQYQVLIEPGLLKTAGERIAKIWSARKVALISDDNVALLYQADLAAQLTAHTALRSTAMIFQPVKLQNRCHSSKD